MTDEDPIRRMAADRQARQAALLGAVVNGPAGEAPGEAAPPPPRPALTEEERWRRTLDALEDAHFRARQAARAAEPEAEPEPARRVFGAGPLPGGAQPASESPPSFDEQIREAYSASRWHGRG
jgi:hypothetical protein